MQVPRERRCLIGKDISIVPIIFTFTDGPHLCGLNLPTVVEQPCTRPCDNHDDSFCEQNYFCDHYWPATTVLKDDILPRGGGSEVPFMQADFWRSIDASGGTFRIDLGCKAMVNEFQLRNGGIANM